MNSYARGYLAALDALERDVRADEPTISIIVERRKTFLDNMERMEILNAENRIREKYRKIRENGFKTVCYPDNRKPKS